MSCSQIKLGFTLPVACCLLLAEVAPLAGQGNECARRQLASMLAIVTDQTTRAPLFGATVSARWDAHGDRQTSAQTDSAGRVIICIPLQQSVLLRSSYRDIKTAHTTTVSLASAFGVQAFVIDVPGSLVRGRVFDQQNGNAVSGVVVRLARMTALTDTAGRFLFDRVPIGHYDLRFDHIAYARNTTPLEVGDDDLEAVVPLTPAAIPLKPIVVTAFSRRLESVGFYERQKRGVGTFIDRKQIDAINAQDASDLLRRVPGLRLVPQNRRNAGQPRNATVGRRAHCRYAFIVDGARTLQDFEMDNLAAPALEGIEVYNGLAGVPANFKAHWSSANDYSLCGVIAIWTRDSR